MIKKVCTLFAMMSAVVFTIVIYQSCTKKKPIYCDVSYEDAYIKDVRITTSGSVQGDTVIFTGSANFLVMPILKTECCFKPTTLFISSCYATALTLVPVSRIDSTSFKLSFNRDITIDGTTLAANSNLLDLPAFAHNGFEKEDGWVYNMDYKLTLDHELLSKIAFDTLAYTTTISCATTDNKQFSKKIVAFFRK